MRGCLVLGVFAAACSAPTPRELYRGSVNTTAPLFGVTSDSVVVVDDDGIHEIDLDGIERPLVAPMVAKLGVANGWITWTSITSTGATVWRRGATGHVESIDTALSAQGVGLFPVTGGIVISNAFEAMYWGEGPPIAIDMQMFNPLVADGDWLYGFTFSGAFSRMRFDGSVVEPLGVSLSLADSVAARGNRIVYATHDPASIYMHRVFERNLDTGTVHELGRLPKRLDAGWPPAIAIDAERLFVGAYRRDGDWTRFLPRSRRDEYRHLGLIENQLIWLEEEDLVGNDYVLRVLAIAADGEPLPDSSLNSDDRGPFL